MRVLTLAILLVPSVAAADHYFQLSGGLSEPVGDDDWNDAAEPSPKLSGRVGGVNNKIGGFLSVDWIPQQLDNDGFSIPGLSQDISGQRFRLLVGPAFEAPLTHILSVSARLGLGADIAHVNVHTSSVIGSDTTSDTDVGFAFEVGGGVWAKLGGVQVGGELGLPIGHHDHAADDQGEIPMQWTSYDFDIMVGVRFMQD